MQRSSITVLSLFLALLPLASSAGGRPTSSARTNVRAARQARGMHTPELSIPRPAGLAFSPSGDLFFVLGSPGGTVALMTRSWEAAGSLSLPPLQTDPINMTYDGHAGRLLIFDDATGRLMAIPAPDGIPDPSGAGWLELPPVGPLRARGLAVDPADGALFILDGLGRRIVRIALEPNGGSGWPGPGRWEFSVIPLAGIEGADLRGLAFDPGSGHLFVLNHGQWLLHELTAAGRAVGAYDLARTELRDPRAMAFAPSGDRTDDPATLSLYVADTGQNGIQTHGHVIELSLTAPETVTALAPLVASNLVHIIETSTWSPPSPDPSGLAYDPVRNRLLTSDGEVEEMSIWANVNYSESTLGGSFLEGFNVTSFTHEPVGVAHNPASGHLFISDDDQDRVFEIDKGPDGRFRTSDDRITSFGTSAFGSGDPEGIAVDHLQNRLFIADGVNAEIYEVLPGANGRFDGVPNAGDDQVRHFDTASLGIQDPETVEFNAASGTLFTIGKDGDKIVEITTTGALIREIDTSYLGLDRPAGLAYAPRSVDPSARSLYIADRRVDNCTNPKENDGRIYEIAIGSSGNQPPIVSAGPDQGITLPATASLNGTVSDDGLPSGTLTTSWSKVSGPGTVTFGNASAVDTTASFGASGTYLLRLTASDGAATASDDVQITASSSGGSPNEFRVSSGPDDAEESATGAMDLASSDLELVFDASNQKVGMRFTGVAIPRGASIASAYVQFKVDEVNSETTSLTIRGQAADSASVFTTSPGDISSRPTTGASTSWAPAPWTTVGEAGLGQRTPDIGPIIQEIVGRTGWVSGNALVLVITGTGHRTAESYDGDVTGAALLHVEIQSGGPSNQPPSVSAGPDQTITLPADASLDGTVSDDGLPSGTLTTTWSQVSGPGIVTFGNPGAVDTTAGFSAPGTYVLQLTANDGAATTSDTVQITADTSGVNTPPSVSAGPDQTILLPAGASLDGTVSDDGLPSGTLTVSWSKLSGPGTVTFGNPGAVDTTATFSGPGVYVLQLTANDGAATASDQVQVTANQAPSVSAGPDQTIRLPAAASLDGTALDDGLPAPLTTTWSEVSGPGTVTFQNASAADTSASFSAPGVYLLRLTASDGAATASDDVRIFVRDALTNRIPLDIRIGTGSDDAEENARGRMTLSSSDLQMVLDKDAQQVGLRFAGVLIPQGAIVRSAYVQFKADEVDSVSTSLSIAGHATDNAPTFTAAKHSISSRTRTAVTVPWSPAPWTTVGSAGGAQQTPDLSVVIQSLVNRPGWSSGNALALLITGSGRRTARSFEGEAGGAALLHLEFE
jgi:K319-like protein